MDYTVRFDTLNMTDIEHVGGKNASLGEMISRLSQAGVNIPGGFATHAQAYRNFLSSSGLDRKINDELSRLDVSDIEALTTTGARIRRWIIDTPLPTALTQAIKIAYEQMEKDHGPALSVAVRSSATAEDLPDASFAGQQETYLNISGLENVLSAVKHVFASLYNDRAIAYRVHHGFAHELVALSVGIQRMVRSDLSASGVMFTLDTESGFRDVVFITAAYGLGETVVQGAVNPDEFYVHKPTLAAGRPAIIRRNLGSKAVKMIYGTAVQSATEHMLGASVKTVNVDNAERMRFSLSSLEIETLAKQALIIEDHYGRAMDIEWAKDGHDGQIYILQARPETVKSRVNAQVLQRYHLKSSGSILTSGRSIGQRIGSGPARVISGPDEMHRVQAGDVLVTDMTDPDWEPIMKRASAIVTNRGGRTCHAAIIARELGIPAVVGCVNATSSIAENADITVSCAEGDTGNIYAGLIDFDIQEISLAEMPDLPFKISMNVGNPDRAFDFSRLPNAGVGLARLEFIINRMIGVHPKALLEFDALSPTLRERIGNLIAGYADPVQFYIEKLSEGIASIAAAFYPKQVIVRLSDFKSNEYANLVGGDRYEPHEENPMLGYRGASRYLSPDFRACFELECQALKKVRDIMGLRNVEIMVPFVRTLAEAEGVIELLAQNGLERGKNNLKIVMMCELPSNALMADEFLQYFDGFSIGSNDMTQLGLGLDRDSGLVAHLFDERDPAVKKLLSLAIQACRRQDKYVGICGQGPSDHPDLARWLMDEGIESVSLNPDSVVETWLFLAGESVV